MGTSSEPLTLSWGGQGIAFWRGDIKPQETALAGQRGWVFRLSEEQDQRRPPRGLLGGGGEKRAGQARKVLEAE